MGQSVQTTPTSQKTVWQIKSRIPKTAVIGVLCGGPSAEREVSLRSGQNCWDALQRLGYTNATLIDVDENIAQTIHNQKIEIAFLTVHGQYGEDGCIQGLLELLKIPYTGNRVTASAITMDKDITKRLLKEAGLPILPSVMLQAGEAHSPQAILKATQSLPFPVMVKPASQGSSVGMSKVNTPEDLPAAVAEALRHDVKVLVESYRVGQSLTVGVVEINGTPEVTPILELRPKTEWYDYEAKYTAGMTEFILPAEINAETTRNIQATTLAAHHSMGCRGVSRIDFILDAEGCYYILEVNTIPGMTTLSDLPAQAEAMGLSYDQLVEALLQTALPTAEAPPDAA